MRMFFKSCICVCGVMTAEPCSHSHKVSKKKKEEINIATFIVITIAPQNSVIKL